MDDGIKAILFDSGRVLNKPTTGHWFITPNFFRYVDQNKFAAIPKVKIKGAFGEAGKYITSQRWIRTEQEEFTAFLEYYRIFFRNLPELRVNDETVLAVTRDLVYNYDKYDFFPDVLKTIPVLNKHYKLAVISDAWPSLEGVFKQAGLREYFSAFVISSQIGATKPDELMYQKALEELNVAPQEAVFIDDNLRNCEGAEKLGIKTMLLCRDFRAYLYYKLSCRKQRVIRNLDQLNL